MISIEYSFKTDNRKTFDIRVSLDRKLTIYYAISPCLRYTEIGHVTISLIFMGVAGLLSFNFLPISIIRVDSIPLKPKYITSHCIYINGPCWVNIFVPTELSNLHLSCAMMAFTDRILPSGVKTTKQRTSSKEGSGIRDDSGHKITANQSSVR